MGPALGAGARISTVIPGEARKDEHLAGEKTDSSAPNDSGQCEFSGGQSLAGPAGPGRRTNQPHLRAGNLWFPPRPGRKLLELSSHKPKTKNRQARPRAWATRLEPGKCETSKQLGLLRATEQVQRTRWAASRLPSPSPPAEGGCAVGSWELFRTPKRFNSSRAEEAPCPRHPLPTSAWLPSRQREPQGLSGQIRCPRRPAHTARGLGSSHRLQEGPLPCHWLSGPQGWGRVSGSRARGGSGAVHSRRLAAQLPRSPLDGVWSQSPGVGVRST